PQSGPKLLVAEEAVDDGGSVARRRLALEAEGELAGITPAVLGRVTTRAGHGPGFRPARVPEELLSQCDLLGRGGILVGNVRGLLLEPQGKLVWELDTLGPARDDEEQRQHPPIRWPRHDTPIPGRLTSVKGRVELQARPLWASSDIRQDPSGPAV